MQSDEVKVVLEEPFRGNFEHFFSKGHAINFLKSLGFKPHEIQMEYQLDLSQYGFKSTHHRKNKFIVDVVGISDGRKVAIEVSDFINAKRIGILELCFDEVYTFPKSKLPPIFLDVLFERRNKLRSEIENLNQKIYDLKKSREELLSHIRKLIKERERLKSV